MLKKIKFTILFCIAGLAGSAQKMGMYEWAPNPLSIGLGVTQVGIDSGIWSMKIAGGFKLDSIRPIKFGHASILFVSEVLGKNVYTNANSHFGLPLVFNMQPKGYFGFLNQSLSFRIGFGPQLFKRVSLMPTVQFETSNLKIFGNGSPSNDFNVGKASLRYYSYMGTLYAGWGFVTYGSISEKMGLKIGYQRNKIYFSDNYGNNEKKYGGPRRIWEFALYIKKLPKAKRNLEVTVRYNILNQHIKPYEMHATKPGFGTNFGARPGANIHASQFFLDISIPLVWKKKLKKEN